MSVDTISSELKALQTQQALLHIKLTAGEAALIAYQEELNDLDAKERRLLVKLGARHFMDDPVKAAAIGRQVLMAMASDVNTLCAEDLFVEIDKLLTDDRCRIDCGLAIEFSDDEQRVISRLKSLDGDGFQIVTILSRHNRYLPAKEIKQETDLTYSQIDSILKKAIDLDLVYGDRQFDSEIGRDRNFYRLSRKVTERIMRWGFQSTQATPNQALLAQAAQAQLCSSVDLN